MTGEPLTLVEPIRPPRHPAFGVSIVVPCWNEGSVLRAAHARILAELDRYDLEVIYVDDGSTDDTLEILQELSAGDVRVHFLSFTRNFGFMSALHAGFRYATKPWIVQLDVDLQFPPDQVHVLLDHARTSGHDAVFGVRTTHCAPWPRRLGSWCYHNVAHHLLAMELPRRATTFRALRTALAQRIVEAEQPITDFMASVPMLTSRYSAIPVRHEPRAVGRSRFRILRLARHAFDLYFGFSTRLGSLTVGLAVLAAIGLAASGVLNAVGAPGAGLVAALSVSAGLLSVAAIGRYLVGWNHARQRPAPYLIRTASRAVRPADLLEPSPPVARLGARESEMS